MLSAFAFMDEQQPDPARLGNSTEFIYRKGRIWFTV